MSLHITKIKTKIKSEIFTGTIFNQFRYYIFRLTDINSNRGRLNFYFFTSLIYNVFFSLLPIIAICPIIINFVFSPSTNNINEYISFNNIMSKFMFVEYIGCILLIFNFLVGLLVSDYKFPFVYKRINSIFIYTFKISNLYKITSCIVLIVLFNVYGHFENTKWFINFNVLGTNFQLGNDYNINQYESWNPGQLIFITIFIVNIISIIPNIVLGFKEKKYIQTKNNSLWLELKKNWRTLFYATIFLVLIVFIFSFILLKIETSYYSDWASQHPDQSITDAPNYSYSPKNYGEAIWYCLITITTVGYGQIIPQAQASRIVAVFLIIIGVSYYSFYSVFFINLYSKFIHSKKTYKNNDIQNFKNELIKDLVKFKVIDEDIYNKISTKQNIYSESNFQNDSLLKYLNKNITNKILLNQEFDYTLSDCFNGQPSIMVCWSKKDIDEFLKNNKIFKIDYNPFLLINRVSKISIYDFDSSTPILEISINKPKIITENNKKYIKYRVNNIQMYLSKNVIKINNFNIGNYKYIN